MCYVPFRVVGIDNPGMLVFSVVATNSTDTLGVPLQNAPLGKNTYVTFNQSTGRGFIGLDVRAQFTISGDSIAPQDQTDTEQYWMLRLRVSYSGGPIGSARIAVSARKTEFRIERYSMDAYYPTTS